MSHKSLREPLNSLDNVKLRNKLISLRKENHFTQKELAIKLSVPQSYVSKVELGQRRLDFFELKKYLQILNFSIENLLDFID